MQNLKDEVRLQEKERQLTFDMSEYEKSKVQQEANSYKKGNLGTFKAFRVTKTSIRIR